jgi:hypothetical protein
MSCQTLTADIVELLDEAAGARLLAATLRDTATIRDLLNYALALESDASRVREQSMVLQTL